MADSKKKPRGGTQTGWTTGACSAAAARAATLGLVFGKIPDQVQTRLPNNEIVSFAVAQGVVNAAGALAVVIKDAGDDPDCTHGAQLTAHVHLWPNHPNEIQLLGGDGVGTVTRLGLGLPPGAAAINPVPQKNIIENVRAAAGAVLDNHGLIVVLSVPGGETLAQKTLNPRLGIQGGISILGTTGIVYPYSTSAYKAAVCQAIQAAAASGVTELVLTTGRRTERFAMDYFPSWPEHAFVQMGDFVGAALAAVGAANIRSVVVAAMAGKLAKMAQGVKNTHAHKNSLDMEAVADLAIRAGASSALAQEICQGVTVRYAAERLQDVGLTANFYRELARSAHAKMAQWLPANVKVSVLALGFDGQLLAEITGVRP